MSRLGATKAPIEVGVLLGSFMLSSCFVDRVVLILPTRERG